MDQKNKYDSPMSWRTLSGLILCNVIWSTVPAAGKILMEELPALQVSWLRYFFALVSSLIVFVFLKIRLPKKISPLDEIKKNFGWIFFIGLVTFFGSAYSQYEGLSRSTPTENTLIVAMEPIFAALLAWLLLKEKFQAVQATGFFVAVLGFCLLSNIKPNNFWHSLSMFNAGNILLLVSIPGEAMYSIVSRKLSGKVNPITLFSLSLPIGFFALSYFMISTGINLPALQELSWKGFLCAAWIGVFGSTIAYVFWTFALIDSPVATVSLTLFVQPIMGTIIGTTFLGDKLDFWQCIGGLFILLALYIQTRSEMRRVK